MGSHGLPLIGTGDWNDGMNRVGEHGRGESVWLGWFLHATLIAFAPLARERSELALAGEWLEAATRLRSALEQHAWDGDWYRRGFFDDGTPLGSAGSDECRIDAIAQSWSVISGAANPARAARAMESLEAQLLRRDPPLALLFTPPFEKSLQEPGYVKAYPRGIRENGGQYTHAAVWTLIALAMQGKADRAMEVFSMLNPIRRSMTRADAQRYKVEPYAVAADVYSRSAARGPRWLDLVHRFGGLAVSGRPGMDPRFPPARQSARCSRPACRRNGLDSPFTTVTAARRTSSRSSANPGPMPSFSSRSMATC